MPSNHPANFPPGNSRSAPPAPSSQQASGVTLNSGNASQQQSGNTRPPPEPPQQKTPKQVSIAPPDPPPSDSDQLDSDVSDKGPGRPRETMPSDRFQRSQSAETTGTSASSMLATSKLKIPRLEVNDGIGKWTTAAVFDT